MDHAEIEELADGRYIDQFREILPTLTSAETSGLLDAVRVRIAKITHDLENTTRLDGHDRLMTPEQHREWSFRARRARSWLHLRKKLVKAHLQRLTDEARREEAAVALARREAAMERLGGAREVGVSLLGLCHSLLFWNVAPEEARDLMEAARAAFGASQNEVKRATDRWTKAETREPLEAAS